MIACPVILLILPFAQLQASILIAPKSTPGPVCRLVKIGFEPAVALIGASSASPAVPISNDLGCLIALSDSCFCGFLVLSVTVRANFTMGTVELSGQARQSPPSKHQQCVSFACACCSVATWTRRSKHRPVSLLRYWQRRTCKL